MLISKKEGGILAVALDEIEEAVDIALAAVAA